ncbi:MAG: polysaccharide export protein [Desulfobacteraceae bacterium]|nr:MAG: polysaccharide export protein [Desulfobacteraceae bacterium]
MIGYTVTWAAGPTYLTGPGDVLEISVWKDESLSRSVVIPPDGIISFPLIGDVNANNVTVAELRKTLITRLSEFLPDPTVTVTLTEINSLRAYVIGNVNKPGEFPITQNTTVTQLLSMANGLNPYASADRISILRRESESALRIPFNYKEIAKGKKLEQDILLRRGDVVVVP